MRRGWAVAAAAARAAAVAAARPGMAAAAVWPAALAALAAAQGCGGGDDIPHDPTGVVAADLGWLGVNTSGMTDEVEVPVPPETVSLTLVASNPIAGELLFRLTNPMGVQVTGDNNICQSVAFPLRHYPQGGTSVVFDTVRDKAALVPGTYRVRVHSAGSYTTCEFGAPAGPGPVSLRALWKMAPLGADGQPGWLRGQRLAVNVFLVGEKQTPLFDRALAHMRTVFRQVGIDVGPPAVYVLGGDAEKYARLSVDDEVAMRALFTRSSMAAEDGVNVFVVREITAGPGYILFGLAAGIPGTPERGSERSGVIVSGFLLDSLAYTDKFIGQVMAHEAGHFLGLWHTTELDGTGDQIDDTPNCAAFNDTNHNGVVDRKECLREDGNNLMFWEGDTFGDKETSAAGTLTPGQGAIVLGSASTR